MIIGYRVTSYGFLAAFTGLSGSLLYHVCYDLYQIKVTEKQKELTPLKEASTLVNPGLFVGLALGASLVYTGKPLVDNLFK